MHILKSREIKTAWLDKIRGSESEIFFSFTTNPLKWTRQSSMLNKKKTCPFVSLLDTQGYVYSTFLKQYNPLRDSQRAGQMVKEQQQQQPPATLDEDFDDLSLFVSGSGSSSLRSFSLNATDSGSMLSGLQGEQESPEDLVDTLDNEAQQVCVFPELFLYVSFQDATALSLSGFQLENSQRRTRFVSFERVFKVNSCRETTCRAGDLK